MNTERIASSLKRHIYLHFSSFAVTNLRTAVILFCFVSFPAVTESPLQLKVFGFISRVLSEVRSP